MGMISERFVSQFLPTYRTSIGVKDVNLLTGVVKSFKKLAIPEGGEPVD